jgi:hypothetical protein
MAFTGPAMKLKQATTTSPVTWDTVKGGTDQTAYLAYSTTNNPGVGFATRSGYLTSTADDTGTIVTDVGHVFGRLGEGNKNMPDVRPPFYWGE